MLPWTFVPACSKRVGEVPAWSDGDGSASWLAVSATPCCRRRAGQRAARRWACCAISFAHGACHVEPSATWARKFDPATAKVSPAAREADHVRARSTKHHLTSRARDNGVLAYRKQLCRRFAAAALTHLAASSAVTLEHIKLLACQLSVKGGASRPSCAAGLAT